MPRRCSGCASIFDCHTTVQDAPVELVGEVPAPGHIVSRSELPELEATELVLSNGMRVSQLQRSGQLAGLNARTAA